MVPKIISDLGEPYCLAELDAYSGYMAKTLSIWIFKEFTNQPKTFPAISPPTALWQYV